MIVFASRTGNVRYIANKLSSIPTVEMNEGLIIDLPFFIFTYTDGLGNTPKEVLDFLENNYKLLRGVIASGNTNFGSGYCGSADEISIKYNVPIIRKIDLRGNQDDIDAIERAYKLRIEGDSIG